MDQDPRDHHRVRVGILSALTEECEATSATLREIPAGAWSRPALGEWNLAQLVAHIVGGVERVTTYLDEPEPEARSLIDPVTYYRYDYRDVAPGVAQRARDRAAQTDPRSLPDIFAATWAEARARASAEKPKRVMKTFRGPMRLNDYLKTRVLEVVVHHADVRAALALPPVATRKSARITIELLEGLLGASRPRDMEPTWFIHAATGRIPTKDPRFPALR